MKALGNRRGVTIRVGIVVCGLTALAAILAIAVMCRHDDLEPELGTTIPSVVAVDDGRGQPPTTRAEVQPTLRDELTPVVGAKPDATRDLHVVLIASEDLPAPPPSVSVFRPCDALTATVASTAVGRRTATASFAAVELGHVVVEARWLDRVVAVEPLQIEPGTVPQELVLELRTQGPRVRGRVTTAFGDAAVDATVAIASTLPAVGSASSTGFVARVDRHGAFESAPLSPGTYEVTVLAGEPTTRSSPKPIVVERADVEVELQLPAVGALRGRVVDVAGSPITADLVAYCEDKTNGSVSNVVSARTDPRSGTFAFEGLACGSYTCVAQAPGWTKARRTIEVRADRIAECTISLERACSLSVVVRTKDGVEVPTSFSLIDAPDELDASFEGTITAPTGAHRWDGMWPGTYRVRAEPRESAWIVSQPIRLGPGCPDARVEWVAESGGTLDATLAGVDPQVGRGRVVFRGILGDWQVLAATLDADGHVCVPHVAAGTSDVTIEFGEHRATLRLTFANDETTSAHFAFDALASH